MSDRDKFDARSRRLKNLIDKMFPARGRFDTLENISGISKNKWKNFYYEKQNATGELIEFWCKKYSADSDYLISGAESESDFRYPFCQSRPSAKIESISDRLIWAISEFASAQGEQLFSYLERRSKGTVTALEWSKVILKTQEPAAEMIRVICRERPYFTEWIMCGSVSDIQVNPADDSSIKRWLDFNHENLEKRAADYFNKANN
jgi:hypothetical protein